MPNNSQGREEYGWALLYFKGLDQEYLHFALLLDLYKLATERPPNKRTASMISAIDKCVINITNEIVICQTLDQVVQNDNPERKYAQGESVT